MHRIRQRMLRAWACSNAGHLAELVEMWRCGKEGFLGGRGVNFPFRPASVFHYLGINHVSSQTWHFPLSPCDLREYNFNSYAITNVSAIV